MTLPVERARTLLAEVRERLETAAKVRTPVLAAGATDDVGVKLATAAEERRQFNLRQVRLASERLEAGEYGYCLSCGEDIDAERLLDLPLTPTCANCSAMRTF